MRRALLILLFAAVSGIAARAVQPNEILPDPALESRARAISVGLRCLVCQNQSIDESEAPLARDLRIMIRERLTAGDSDEAAINFVVARYGDYVLLKPRVTAATLILWFGPFVLLAGAAAMLWRRGKIRAAPAEAALSDEEKQKLDRALSG